MLELKGINKVYGSGQTAFQALYDVNINFGSKGLVVIVGKSGCGKSTLLNIMGGMDKPTTGEVIINGRSTKTFSNGDYDAYRNTFVGIIFQEFNLIDDISVFDNINMTMKLQEKDADLNTVDEALAMVGLQNLGYRKPSELSGGQRQRVSIARALLKKPDIILADEPTGALDSATGEEVFETLKKIALDKLVIVVTHNRELANTYADRILEISDGRIISDCTRVVKDNDLVKELPSGVIEVSASSSIKADDINNKLVKGKTNYVGISHSKDRIALAYPETFDSFYAKNEATDFSKTDQTQIPSDDKQFKLSKGGIKFKDTLKLAKDNRKRHKKRFRFITFIASLCFVFIALALMVGVVNTNSIVANSAFDGDGPFVKATVYADKDSYTSTKFTEDDINHVKSVTGERLGYGRRMVIQPEKTSNAGQDFYDDGDDYFESYDVSYTFKAFNGIIELNKLSDVGLESYAGSDSCANTDEIIISDFAAYMLGKNGFLGTDKNGEYAIQYLKSPEEIIGYSLSFNEYAQQKKVVGLYKTNYQKYAKLATSNAMTSSINGDIKKLKEKFASEYNFSLCRMIGAKGLGATFSSKQNNYLYLRGHGENLQGYLYADCDGKKWEDVKQSIAAGGSKYGVTTLLWGDAKNGSTIDNFVLHDDEILISAESLRQLLAAYDANLQDATTAQAFVDSPSCSQIKQGVTIDIEVVLNNATLLSRPLKIVGVYYNDYGNGSSYVSDNIIDEVAKAVASYDMIYFPKGSTSMQLQNKISELSSASDKYFAVGSGSARGNVMRELGDMLSTMGTTFLMIALVMFVLAFFIILSYMATSVKFRTKEIAVYRVIGAKTGDVAKIFFSEGGLIVVITTIIATLASLLLSFLLNFILKSVLTYLGLTVSLVRFMWYLPFVILLLSAVTVAISSFIPIIKITSKRPVDAIKMI